MRYVLRKARTERGYSQEEVAKAIGISQRFYSDIETGRADPSWKVAQALAKFFGTPPDILLAMDEPKQRTRPNATTA